MSCKECETLGVPVADLVEERDRLLEEVKCYDLMLEVRCCPYTHISPRDKHDTSAINDRKNCPYCQAREFRIAREDAEEAVAQGAGYVYVFTKPDTAALFYMNSDHTLKPITPLREHWQHAGTRTEEQ